MNYLTNHAKKLGFAAAVLMVTGCAATGDAPKAVVAAPAPVKAVEAAPAAVPDAALVAKLVAVYKADSELGLEKFDVTSPAAGEVVLTGKVLNDWYVWKAGDLAKKNGATKVSNNLKVAD